LLLKNERYTCICSWGCYLHNVPSCVASILPQLWWLEDWNQNASKTELPLSPKRAGSFIHSGSWWHLVAPVSPALWQKSFSPCQCLSSFVFSVHICVSVAIGTSPCVSVSTFLSSGKEMNYMGINPALMPWFQHDECWETLFPNKVTCIGIDQQHSKTKIQPITMYVSFLFSYFFIFLFLLPYYCCT
jgi:hypothetical protein